MTRLLNTHRKFFLSRNILFFIFLLFLPISGSSQDQNQATELNFYTQGNQNRTAAEWEPALGTLIVWPLSIPHKLVIELAKDDHLYTLVENDSLKNEAIHWYNKWGIDSANTTFIFAPQGIDTWWTRDWGPSATFTPEGKMFLADGKYIYSTPATSFGCSDELRFLFLDQEGNIIKTQVDDDATLPLGKGLNIEVLDLPFICTGGNVLNDGLGSAFSSCILLNENAFFNVSEDRFFSLNEELLGYSNYTILSNFEKYGIQHIDCLMKILDEERILVAEPPLDHELYPVYENIVQNELKKLKSVYGRPYEIIRLKTDRYDHDQLAAYTNSIIINKTIYVPLFNIKQDSIAIRTWQEAMPGYTVKGFKFDLNDEPIVTQEMKDHYRTNYGWNSGDALHCRTRAVWDSQMLFMTIKKLEGEVESSNKNIVYSSIIDYSKKGLESKKSELFWRVKGNKKWKSVLLNQTDNETHFFAEIPYHKSGKIIEYYISAESKSGRKETRPRTAPLGTYQFKIK